MSTYSINVGGIYESTFWGNLDPNLFLNLIPNNTSQLIVPEDVRDATYTIWENISYKRVTASGSSIEYIGIGGKNNTDMFLAGENGLKTFIGKPELSGNDIMSNTLLDYTTSDVDLYIYNLKPDNFGGGGADQQYTKVSFLAGDNSSLFLTAPYMLSQQNVGGTAINFTIYNEGGKLTIDSTEELIIGSPNTKITLMYGTGSTGIATKPVGSIGDIQINLDDCVFGAISGSAANIGDVLIMGASNSAYWGSLSLNQVFTLNQVLTAGNTTDGEDIILTNSDSLYIGGTGEGVLSYTSSYTTLKTPNSLKIGASTLIVDITGLGANKALYTNGSGEAYWGTQSVATPGGSSDNIQYNNSGSFGGSNLFKWDTSSSSLGINVPSATYSLSVKANTQGGVYVNTNGTNNGVLVTDGTNNVFKIRTDGTKTIYFDSAAEYNMVFGKNETGAQNKYTFYNGGTLKHMTLAPNTGTQEFKIEYKGSSVVYSMISFSPGGNKGMFLGTKENDNGLSLGGFSGSTYNNSIVVYTKTNSTQYFINRDSSLTKSVVIGNVDSTILVSGAKIITSSNKRSLGINVTPEVDLDLYGIMAIRPETLEILFSGAYFYIDKMISSYGLISEVFSELHRISEYIGGSDVTPYGTTIELWNRSSSNITIHLINEFFNSAYNTDELRNIYYQGGGNNHIWNQGEKIRLVYLDISKDNYLLSKMDDSWEALTSEDGVWHLEVLI